MNLRTAAEKIAQSARAERAHIDQVDAVLCETGDAIMFYAYSGELTFVALIAVPHAIGEGAEFLNAEWSDALWKLLPEAVLAETMSI